jgi:hypothetical protein
MLAARAFPPFNPPSLPSATAAAFFSGFDAMDGNCWPVDCATMFAAIWFKSVLKRLGMNQLCAQTGKIQGENYSEFKLYHYRKIPRLDLFRFSPTFINSNYAIE